MIEVKPNTNESQNNKHTRTRISNTHWSQNKKKIDDFFYRALDRVPNGLEEHEDKSMVIRRVEFRETDICRIEVD